MLIRWPWPTDVLMQWVGAQNWEVREIVLIALSIQFADVFMCSSSAWLKVVNYMTWTSINEIEPREANHYVLYRKTRTITFSFEVYDSPYCLSNLQNIWPPSGTMEKRSARKSEPYHEYTNQQKPTLPAEQWEGVLQCIWWTHRWVSSNTSNKQLRRLSLAFHYFNFSLPMSCYNTDSDWSAISSNCPPMY